MSSKLFTLAAFWQGTVFALCGGIVTAGTLWGSGSLQSVSRADVVEIVDTRSPYVVDQKLILSELRSLSDRVRALGNEQKRTSEQLARLAGAIGLPE